MNAVLLITACTGEQHHAPQLQEFDKPALHAVQSARLQGLMKQLNDLMFERMLTEVELDVKRRQRTRQIAEVAAAMQRSVQDIPKALPTLSLNAKERETFLSLSARLENQVTLLKQEAELNYVDAIRPRVERIVSICNACHQAFRKFPGK
jgi:cytochrome c556